MDMSSYNDNILFKYHQSKEITLYEYEHAPNQEYVNSLWVAITNLISNTYVFQHERLDTTRAKYVKLGPRASSFLSHVEKCYMCKFCFLFLQFHSSKTFLAI